MNKYCVIFGLFLVIFGLILFIYIETLPLCELKSNTQHVYNINSINDLNISNISTNIYNLTYKK